MQGKTRSPRLSRLETLLCSRLGVDPQLVLSVMPEAVIVGEAPGERTQADAPLFPYPRNSAGGRLQIMSGLQPAEYLARFQRMNLLDSYPGKVYPIQHAWQRAELLLRAIAVLGWPMVLCGARVATAFGLEDAPLGEWRWMTSIEKSPEEGGQSHITWAPEASAIGMISQPRAIRIPHPSGRNLLLNAKENRDLTMRALRGALSAPAPGATLPACGTPQQSQPLDG